MTLFNRVATILPFSVGSHFSFYEWFGQRKPCDSMIQIFYKIVYSPNAILTEHVATKQVVQIEFLKKKKKKISKTTLHYQLLKAIVSKYHQIEEVQQIELCLEQLLAICHKSQEPSFWGVINSFFFFLFFFSIIRFGSLQEPLQLCHYFKSMNISQFVSETH